MKDWGAREFHRRFSDPLSHTSGTVEESLRSDRPRVHLHTQLTFRKRIDRKHLGSQIAICVLQTCCSHSPECLRNMTCFQFQNICTLKLIRRCGSDVEASKARAFFRGVVGLQHQGLPRFLVMYLFTAPVHV